MKHRGIPESHSSHPNVTPLIDVVMCLIIFYMLVAKIGVNAGADPTIAIPTAQLGKNLKDLGNTLILNVREVAGTPFVTALVKDSNDASDTAGDNDNAPRQLFIVDPTTGHHQLADVLRGLRYGKDMKPGGTGVNADNDNFKIIIRGDVGDEKNPDPARRREALTYKSLEPVLIACMEANVKEVSFSTTTYENK